MVQQAKAILAGAAVRPRRPHADLWRRLSVAVGNRSAGGFTSDIRWVPSHLSWEEAALGDKISIEDWFGNTKADTTARDALLMHPDNYAPLLHGMAPIKPLRCSGG